MRRWWIRTGVVVVLGAGALAGCGGGGSVAAPPGTTAASLSPVAPSASGSTSAPPSSPAAATPGVYVEEARYRADPQRYAGGRTVLFFHAPWCPTCRAAEKDVLARTAELPPGLVIVKVDYDGATELKQRYGVTRQSTFVQVDGEGRELARFQDATSVDAILARLV